METGQTSQFPLILAQIRPLIHHPQASFTPDTTSGDTQLERTQRFGSQLCENNRPHSAAEVRHWDSEEDDSAPYLHGVFTKTLPRDSHIRDSTKGYISKFLMNPVITALLPCVTAVWQYDRMGLTDFGAKERRIRLLFKSPQTRTVYDLGNVHQRQLENGEPITWVKV